MEYLSLLPAVENVSQTTTEKVLPSIRWKNRESREVEEKLTNNDALIGRIATLEEEQMYQMVQIEILVHFTLTSCVIFYLKFVCVCVGISHECYTDLGGL